MKKAFLAALMLLMAVASASAQSFDDFFNKIKTSGEFSAMTLDPETSKQRSFDHLEIAISETITPATIVSVKKDLALLPKAQLLTDTEIENGYVAIYSMPLPQRMAKLLLVVLNGNNGAVLCGICKQSLIDSELSGLHLNNIFGD